MKKLLLFIFIITVNITFAQPNMPKEKADSLWMVWEDESMPDTSRLKALDAFAWNGYLFTKPDSAFYYAQLQYDFASKKGMKQQMSGALGTQGISFYVKGDYTKAIEYNTRSLEIDKAIGNKNGISGSLNNIGLIYHSQGNYEQAINYYLKSIKIQEEIGHKTGLASSLNNVGLIYRDLGDFAQAVEYYSKSLDIYTELNDKKGVALSQGNMGLIFNDQGNYSQAIDYYFKCLKSYETIGDKYRIARALNNIGVYYKQQGDYDQAIDYYTRSLDIREEIGDQNGIAVSLNNFGSIYAKNEDYNEAIDYYKRSLKIREEIGDNNGIARSLNNIGNIHFDQGDYIQSLEFGEKSYAIGSELHVPERIRDASRLILRTSYPMDKINTARKHVSTIYNILESDVQTNFFTLPEKEKLTYFSTMEEDYGLYHDFTLYYQGKFNYLTDTSYNIALKNKGLTLKSSTAMRQAIKSSGDTTLIKEYENWLSLKKKIAKSSATDSTYKDLVVKASDMERELVKTSNVFSDFDKIRNLNWQDVQSGLNQNEAAIEFVNFKSEIDTTNPIIYAALIIKKDSKNPEMVKLCTETDLKEILGTFQGNNLDFVNSVYGNKDKAQKALYEKVWQPMEKNLEGVENIYLSPSGLLHKVAFHAISKDKNTYLCDSYNIRQQNSTGKVALPNEVAFNSDQKLFMIGGVQYNTDTSFNEVWNYLPGTLEETRSIKSFLEEKQFHVTHLSSSEASEDKFKSKTPHANILHVATHGFFFPDPELVRKELEDNTEYFDDIAFRGNNINTEKMQRSTRYADWTFVKNKNPLMRSGLTLANANDVWQRPVLLEGEDGILTAQEVSTLDLRNTNLVVLSACETGLGDIKGSEGVYGLQRAFKMAGAKYLIMSLWQVPDKETSEFMQLFYKNLVETEDITKAFDQTQKLMRKKYDPYYWAAFVLVE